MLARYIPKREARRGTYFLGLRSVPFAMGGEQAKPLMPGEFSQGMVHFSDRVERSVRGLYEGDRLLTQRCEVRLERFKAGDVPVRKCRPTGHSLCVAIAPGRDSGLFLAGDTLDSLGRWLGLGHPIETALKEDLCQSDVFQVFRYAPTFG